MTTLYDIREKALEMTGDQLIADDLLKSIVSGGNDEWTFKQMRLKYDSMCIEAIRSGQAVNVKEIATGVFLINDYINGTSSICVISEDGMIEFYNKSIEFKSLFDYLDQCSEDEDEDE